MGGETRTEKQDNETCSDSKSQELSQKLQHLKFSRLKSYDDESSKASSSQCMSYYLPNGQKVTHGNVFGNSDGAKSGTKDESLKFRLDYQNLPPNCVPHHL